MSTISDVLSGVKKVLLIEDKVDRMERGLDDLASDVSDLRKGLAAIEQRVADMEGYLRAATRTPFGDRPRIEG